MIVRPKPNLINILTSLKGSIARKIALRCLMVTLLASIIVLVESLHPNAIHLARPVALDFHELSQQRLLRPLVRST
jgi:predicted membrane chloride channel (bestrophin family)